MNLISILGIIGTLLGMASSIGYFYDKFKVVDNKIARIEGNPRFTTFGLSWFSKLTWLQASKTAYSVAQRILYDHYKPTIIIGIGRGGGIYGSLVSYNLFQVPIYAIDRVYDWDKDGRKEDPLFSFDLPPELLYRVLVVAGEAHSGKTMEKFVKYLKQKGVTRIKTCVFYRQIGCTQNIDYCGKEGHAFMLMPWQGRNYVRDSRSKEDGMLLKQQQQRFYNEGETI